ncbi:MULTISPECIES: hypothetical protein [Pseudomonas]|uniref:hypothetical protein n=1 Tax=Pseudomonas TaxID=286 RepID=UPI00190CA603|nr:MULTISPECIES: hypothetical protein [Pseudomonas]MBK3475825.1 hypothetical protein [Pseudomonas sp. MF6751]MBL4981499.1 hypothetical protein [Pseudomonas fluorescens]MBR7214049.1 hypothetical protein [Pseudomonas sp. B2021]GLH50754.1 hypothetical protein RS3R2_44420 [Pseudomonas lactis]
MEPRNIVLCLACFLLLANGLTFGIRFLKKRNLLLALEWFVVAFSATNFLVFFLTGSEHAYLISYFCDAFSRAFGIPLITVLGLMAVTHAYKPSVGKELMMFAGAMLGTLALISTKVLVTLLPYFYVLMWVMFSVYLVYFAVRLANVGESLHAIGVMFGMLASLTIACIYDFYKIPGDDSNVLLNFYVLALTTWAYLLVHLYYAYCALERAKGAMAVLQTR